MRLYSESSQDVPIKVKEEFKDKSGIFQVIPIRLFLLIGIGFLAFQFIPSFRSYFLQSLYDLKSYTLFCIHKLSEMSPFTLFLLFAPALLFDTTRYYLTNTLYFFLWIFRLVERDKKKSLTSFPMVSVIIPTYKEGERVELTLRSVFENNYPSIQVILVDEGVDPIITKVCEKYKNHPNFLYLQKKIRGGKPSSLNYALQFTKGEFVLHLDGDSTLHRNAIREMVKKFQNPKVGAVSGNLRISNQNESLITKFQSIEYGMCINVQRRWLSLTDTLQIASGAFSCFRKKLLLAVQGVDTDEGEDLDISLKIRKMRYRIAFAPRSICYTEVPEKLFKLYTQRKRWDRVWVELILKKHLNLFDPRKFKLTDFFSNTFDFLFNIILLLLLPIYILYLSLFSPSIILFLLFVTLLYYSVANSLQTVLIIIFSDERKKDFPLIFYAPFYFLYSLFLKSERSIAYLGAIFSKKTIKGSYFPDQIWFSMPKF